MRQYISLRRKRKEVEKTKRAGDLARLLAGFFLLLAQPAFGSDWKQSCGTSSVTSVQRGSHVCNDPVAAGNSPMLRVSACENSDALFYRDLTDGGAGTATVQIWTCRNPVDGSGVGPTNAGFDPAGICWVLGNVTLDGNEATATEAIWGFWAKWIFLKTVTFSGLPSLVLHCSP